MKDIFVDTCTAQQFCNPMNEAYKSLLLWIKQDGYLVYTNKLLQEIGQGNQNLLALLAQLIKEGRANKISNEALRQIEFSKKQKGNFLSNGKDWDHIKTVILSNRKLAISGDAYLISDINGLPKYNKIQPSAYDCPSKCPYR